MYIFLYSWSTNWLKTDKKDWKDRWNFIVWAKNKNDYQ